MFRDAWEKNKINKNKRLSENIISVTQMQTLNENNIIIFHYDFEIVNEHLSTGIFVLEMIFDVMLRSINFGLWKKCSDQRDLCKTKWESVKNLQFDEMQKLTRGSFEWLGFSSISHSCHSVSGRFSSFTSIRIFNSSSFIHQWFIQKWQCQRNRKRV